MVEQALMTGDGDHRNCHYNGRARFRGAVAIGRISRAEPRNQARPFSLVQLVNYDFDSFP